MAYNEETQSYDEYPLSGFPGKICNESNMIDVSASLRPYVEQYNLAWSNDDTATIAKLIADHPDLDKSLFNAHKINVLMDELKSLQTWTKEKLIEAVANAVGLKDDATGDDKLINAYSASKVDEIIENYTGVELATNITIATTDWEDDNSVDGYVYSYTYTDDSILETDGINIYFDDTSKIYASKAFVIVKSDTGSGSFTLLSRKIPKIDLTIQKIEVIRRG